MDNKQLKAVLIAMLSPIMTNRVYNSQELKMLPANAQQILDMVGITDQEGTNG